MANIIKPKRSSTAGKVPTTSDLASGELGVNMTDQKTYINNGSAVVQVGSGKLSGLGDVAITSPTNAQALVYDSATSKWVNGTGGGAGDVAGPSSATDNAIARYDGTTGKLIQNSVVTVDDTGNVSGVLSEQYNTVTTPPTIVEGLEAWDSGNGTLELGLIGGNVSYKYGQQEFVRAYNGSGSTMTKGQVVYIVGAQGNRVDVRLAQANAESTSAGTIGFVVETIANGAEGWVQASGSLYKLNTTGLTAGAALYLSPSVAGGYTTTRPTAPNHTVILGWVQRVDTTVGSIYVKVDNGYELNELHNVLINTPTTGQSLVYNATTGVWENSNAPVLSSATGLPLSTGVTGVLPIANGGTGVGSSGGVLAGGFYVPNSVSPPQFGTLPVTVGGTGQTSYTDGQLLIGNSVGNTLTKATLTAGSGISITNGSGAITISASGGSVGAITQNQTTISTNQSLLTGYSGSSVGPMTINTGVTVSVASGQRWVIL